MQSLLSLKWFFPFYFVIRSCHHSYISPFAASSPSRFYDRRRFRLPAVVAAPPRPFDSAVTCWPYTFLRICRFPTLVQYAFTSTPSHPTFPPFLSAAKYSLQTCRMTLSSALVKGHCSTLGLDDTLSFGNWSPDARLGGRCASIDPWRTGLH